MPKTKLPRAPKTVSKSGMSKWWAVPINMARPTRRNGCMAAI